MITAVEVAPALPVPVVPRELAAAVLAVLGPRRGDLVLDLNPSGGLSRPIAAAVGRGGRVLSVGGTGTATPTPVEATGPWRRVATLAEVPDGCVSRVLLLGHASTARELVPLIGQVGRVVLAGARLVVTSRPNNGGLADGLPAVLRELGMRVVHTEGLEVAGARVALACGMP